ncbi:hypothetical protein GH808_11160 [Acetobacterium fimetarium]|uniref:Flagellar hook-length control protein-like C-terminal domain-containing protein n=1 Tax=Acetobacterium fimetarium TaxID=52691 RepID=A0ABR6WXN5_9FIRM|nr:flagellar hook-length control protein FliK [Acetobacterium fimetarium]MBC3804989.1 hypothetical protein [Acetobacterium fimetarium]
MNLEFHSTGNSAMKGLLNVAANVGSSKLEQKGFSEKRTQFKDLFNRSRSDMAQNGINDQDSQPNKGLAKAGQPEKVETSKEAVSTKIDNENSDPTVEQSQESAATSIGNDLLSMVQNYQTALAAVIPNTDPENDGNQLGKEISTLLAGMGQHPATDQTNQAVNSLAQDSIPVPDENSNGMLLNFQEITGQKQQMAAAGEASEVLQPTDLNGQNQTSAAVQAMQQAGFNGQNQKIMAMTENTTGAQTAGLDTQKKTATNEITAGQSSQQTILNGEGQTTTAAGEAAAMLNNADNSQNALSSPEDAATKTGFSTLKEAASELGISEGSENDDGLSGSDNNAQIGPMGVANVSKEQPVPTTPKVALAQQVEQKVLQNYDASKPVSFTMTLSPENLGDIDVQMKYDQGKLVIDIMAVSKETQKLLGKEINQLVRSLALQNVQVDSVHVNTPVEQTTSSSNQNSASLMNGGSDFAQQQQNDAQLRESLIRNSRIFNSLKQASDEDMNVTIPQNLLNNGNYRVNYLI